MATNTLTQVDVLVRQLTNRFKICLKRGRPINSKDVTPQKRRTQGKLGTLERTITMINQSKIDKFMALKEAQIKQKVLEETHIEQEILKEV